MRKRLNELCERLWAGNKAQMAADIDVSPSLLSKVLQGGQSPPGKLIENVARDPRVNLAWLLRGEGLPTDQEPLQAMAMPISKQVLPGPPEKHVGSLSGESYAVAAHLYRQTRYWLEVQPGESVLRAELGIKVRDLLLMDTNRAEIPDEHRLYQHLCGVRVNVEGTVRLKLGRVDYIPGSPGSGPARLELDTFDLAVDPAEIKRKVAVHELRGRKRAVETYHRAVGGEDVPVSDLDMAPILPTISYADIVAIAVLLVRRSPHGA
ncbi:MAG: hypothetical protein NTY19_44030 [Planctomycetota bacterium]|nr:hypothetical protein [Planctomycetota bacterium]